MYAFVARRLLLAIFILLCLSVIVFIAIHSIPGDLAQVMLGPAATEQAVTALRKSMGLDKPLHEQYLSWIVNLVKGNMGNSLRMGTPIIDEIINRLPVTLELIILATLLSLIIAIPIGVVCAVKRNSWFDHLLRPVSILGLSVPDFWWAVLFIILISYYFPHLYTPEYVSILENFGENMKTMIPASVALGVTMAAMVMRYVRSSLSEVLMADYIVTARAKGLTETVTVGKHAMRNSLIDVLTVVGLQMGALLSGAVLVEIVFSLPGVGRMALDAVLQRDYPVVQAVVMIIAVIFILINLLVDILYGVLDPRIRIS